MQQLAVAWRSRSETLRRQTIESLRKNIQNDKSPPYIGRFPGTTLTFRESLGQEKPSPQQWPHRPYAELLQADVLPPDLANLVVDCMQAYGATTLGVVANVGQAHDDGREILGFISYGYAQALLRLDRIEEFLLFLHSHRYHAHTRGIWTAGEVTGITGDSALYCVPAQQTIPLLVRWMLVLEDSDEDRLYLAKGIPRQWVASGKKTLGAHQLRARSTSGDAESLRAGGAFRAEGSKGSPCESSRSAQREADPCHSQRARDRPRRPSSGHGCDYDGGREEI